jgi:hypothetical protein
MKHGGQLAPQRKDDVVLGAGVAVCVCVCVCVGGVQSQSHDVGRLSMTGIRMWHHPHGMAVAPS